MNHDNNNYSDGSQNDAFFPKPSGKGKKKYQKPRNGNVAQRKQDATRRKFGLLALESRYRQREELLYPNGPPDRMDVTVPLGLTDATLTPCHFVLPYATVGISFAVNQLFLRYYDQLSPHFTIFQFYRYTLAQLEFVRVHRKYLKI